MLECYLKDLDTTIERLCKDNTNEDKTFYYKKIREYAEDSENYIKIAPREVCVWLYTHTHINQHLAITTDDSFGPIMNIRINLGYDRPTQIFQEY